MKSSLLTGHHSRGQFRILEGSGFRRSVLVKLCQMEQLLEAGELSKEELELDANSGEAVLSCTLLKHSLQLYIIG
jgi:hypothetical protein